MLRRAAKREKELSEKTSRVKRIKPEEDDSEARALGEKDTSAIEALRELEKSVLGDDQDIIEELTKSKETKVKVEAPPCAWVDEEQDDAGIINVPRVIPSRLKVSGKINKDTYQSKLKDEFSKVTGNPSWAKLDWEKDESEKKDDPDSDTEGLLTSTGDYIASSALLPRGLIQMRSCADANKQYTSQGRLNASEFHPSAQVLLAAGMDQRLNLFQIDGKHNPKIQSIFLQNYPVHSAHFTADGQQVVAGSKFRSFYYYDMMAGKVVNVPWIKALEENQMRRFEVSPDGRFLAFYGMYGRIHLLSSQSKEHICTLKMNGSVEALSFNQSGDVMCSHGDDGQVYVWDMNTRDCIHHFTDDGCIHGTSLAHSPDGRYLAAGCSSGVVNIYDTSKCYQEVLPKPLKAIMNLTTSASHLKFNSTSEILAIASNAGEKAVKLIHFPSMTAFSNFPDRTENFRIPNAINFSLNSGYFTIGNNKGNALLYRVQHYTNY